MTEPEPALGILAASSARGLPEFRGHSVPPKSGPKPRDPQCYVFWSLDSVFQEAYRSLGTEFPASQLLWELCWAVKGKRTKRGGCHQYSLCYSLVRTGRRTENMHFIENSDFYEW